jgi:hypothetical protein
MILFNRTKLRSRLSRYHFAIVRILLPVTASLATLTGVHAQNSISMYSPTNGTVYLQPTNVPLKITLQASVSAPNTAAVDFYDGTNFIASAPVPQNSVVWSNVSFGTHSVFAVLRLSGGGTISSSPIEVSVEYGGYAIIPPGSAWAYRDGGVDLGTQWRGTNVDVSAWPQGLAKLGFGDDDVVTLVNWQNPNNGEVYPTYYFRRPFLLPNPLVHSNVAVRLRRDDGAIVYLNGDELFRDNMPPGEANYRTYAAHPVPDENEFIQHWFNRDRLRAGTNYFAVEIHNMGPHNEDIGFDFALVADIPTVAKLDVRRAPTNIMVSWPIGFDGYGLESSSTLGSNAIWQRLTNNFGTVAGFLVHTNESIDSATFFRLRLE